MLQQEEQQRVSMVLESDTLAKRFGLSTDAVDQSLTFMRKSVDKEYSDQAKLIHQIKEASTIDERKFLARARIEGKIIEPQSQAEKKRSKIRVRNCSSMLGFSKDSAKKPLKIGGSLMVGSKFHQRNQSQCTFD